MIKNHDFKKGSRDRPLHAIKSNETRWKRHTCQHCYKK